MQRARIVLLAAQGASNAAIARACHCAENTVRKWRARFAARPMIRTLQRVTVHYWTLECATHTGRWEKTGCRGPRPMVLGVLTFELAGCSHPSCDPLTNLGREVLLREVGPDPSVGSASMSTIGVSSTTYLRNA